MNKKQHFSTLDSLRGFAALSVCLYHFTGSSLPKFNNNVTDNLFTWGWVGVDIFFVISGFIIPYVMVKGQYKAANILTFLGKRFIRISPPAYIAMILVIVQYFLIDYFKLSANNWFSTLSVSQILHNFSYTIPFTEYKWVNGVFWTLSIEFQYYIFIAFTFIFIFKNAATFFASVLIIACSYYLPIADTVNFFHYNSMFLLGFATLFYIEKRIDKIYFIILLGILTIAAYLQLGLLAALFGLITAIVIAFVQIKNKIGDFFGKISYSLYLTHITFGSTLEGIFIKFINPDTLLTKLLLLITCIAITISLSWLFYKTFELYFIKLSNCTFGRTRSVTEFNS